MNLARRTGAGLSARSDEYVVDGDGAQAAAADEVGELTEYVSDRQMIEVAGDFSVPTSTRPTA